MKTYLVNADFYINVQVEVEAESEDEAKEEAKGLILNKNCEWMDPINEPSINWAELISSDEENDDVCGCDCHN